MSAGGATTRIQEGVNLLSDGSLIGSNRIVDAEPGTYAEAVSINKSMRLLGEQVGVNGVGRGGAESIITSPIADLTTSLVTVTANDVTIDGMTLDGDNTSLDGTPVLDTGDSNARRGMRVLGSTNVVFQNNRVLDFYARGVQYEDSAPTVVSSGTVTRTAFDNIGDTSGNDGYALLSFDSVVNFTNNEVTDTNVGPFYQFLYTGTAALSVTTNVIDAVQVGIGFNQTGSNVGLITVDTNVVTMAAGGLGAQLWSMANSGGSNFNTNTFSGSGVGSIGIYAWTGTSAMSVPISGGSISGFETGAWITNDETFNPFGPANASTNLAISGVSITPAAGGTGVYVVDTPGAPSNQVASATLSGGTTINLDATAKGVSLDGTLAQLGGNSLGNTSFTAPAVGLYQYVVLANAAYGPNGEINGTGANYNGVAGGPTLSVADGWKIEDHITHRLDAAGIGTGLVRIRAAKIYVTPNSGSIQRGVDAATAGDDVHVQDSTYTLTSAVNVNKQLQLLGRQASVDARTRTAVPETIVDGSAVSGFPVTALNVSASGVVVDGFTIQGISGAQAQAGITLVAGTNGSQIRNNIIKDNNVGLFVANNSSTNATVVEHNLFLDNTASGSASGHGVYADDFTAGPGMQNVDIQNNKFANTVFVLSSFGVGMSNSSASTPFNDISVLGNEIDNFGRGMYFFHTANSTVDGNDIDGATRYAVGIFGITGVPANSNLSVSNNTLTNNGTAIWIDDDAPGTAYSGTLTTSGNTYTTGVNKSIIDTSTAAVNATADMFNGVLASSATTSQQFVIVDTIVDGVDAPARGLVRTRASNVYVTPNSFYQDAVYLPVGTTTPDVQRGIDVASNTDIVNIKTGIYAGNITTSGKSVTLAPGSSPGQVTINGNLALDGNDALAMEINGLTPGTTHDQFIVNGTLTLNGATLNTTGSTIVATQGQTLTIIDNDTALDPVVGFFAAPANGNGNVILVNGQPFFVFYNGGDGNDVTLTRAPNGTLPGPQPAPNVVFVNDDWAFPSFSNGMDTDGPSGGTLGNGTAKGIDEFDNIQDAINAVAAGGEIRIYGGNYVQSLVVNKSLRLLGEDFILSGTVGDNLNDVVVDPTATATNDLLISASNVEVAGILIEGDTTDSYGILATHPTNTLTGIHIHDNLVRNLFRRGIQTDTYLASFNIHDNVVANVVGDPEAIGIFNFGGGGGGAGLADIHDNTVTGSTVAIEAQQSAGMHVFDNIITMVAGGVGIQDSDPGTGSPPPSGASETFINNTITGGDAGAYGLIVINAAMDTLLQDNNVTTPGVGMGTYGHFGTPLAITTFDGNTVDAGTIGIEVSTDTFGFNGIQSVSAIITDNHVSGSTGAGILINDTDGAGAATATANINNNTTSIHDNFIGIDVNGGVATIAANDIHNNTTGIRVRNGGSATLSSNQFNANGLGLLADGGSATITDTQQIDGVGIGNAGLVTLAFGTNTVLITTTLNISGTGKLDIRDNAAIVNYTGASPLVSIQGRLVSGYAGGAWTGAGIMSTDAANEPNQRTGVGYAEATDLFNSFPATFEGQTIDNTSVLLKYTLYGDADLNGNVNVNDFTRLASSFGQTGRRWSQGDFDYNFNVNVNDFTRLASNFGQSGFGPTSQSAGERNQALAELEQAILSNRALAAGKFGARLIADVEAMMDSAVTG